MAIDWAAVFVFLAETAALAESGGVADNAREAPSAELEPSGAARHGANVDLKAEFDRICAKVPAAVSLGPSELGQLIADSRSLQESLRQSDLAQAKILIKRLQMCIDFFQYALEASAGDDAGES